MEMSYDMDELIKYYLYNETDYYINGGKAFNFYYPEDMIPTEDTDMIATESVCKRLFYNLNHILGKTISLTTGTEKIMVHSCRFQDTTYNDETPQGTVFRRVRSFLVNKITVIDVTIVDSVDPYDIYKNIDGTQYIAHDLFYNDLLETLQDRIQKTKLPTKKSKTRSRRKEKLSKTEQRVSIAEKYKNMDIKYVCSTI